MNDTELKEVLLAIAQGKEICKPGYERMLMCDIDGLVDYYLEMPDWCMERGFPDFATLKEHFTGFENKGAFIGKTFHGEVLNDLQTYIFHKCTGTIKVGLNVEKGIIPMLYLANGCRLRIMGTGDFKPKKESERSAVPVYTFGKNDVSARDNKYVRFIRYNSDLIL